MQQPQGSCLIQGREKHLNFHFDMMDADIVSRYVWVKGRCLGGESGGETKYVGK